MRKIKREKERATIIDTIISAYIDAKMQIISKIKVSVQNYPMVAKQLNTTTTVRATGEDISNPYSNNNLSGIIECLYDKYRKRTFVTFTNNLIEVMSFSITKEQTENNPWTSFEEMEIIMANWKKRIVQIYDRGSIFQCGIFKRHASRIKIS
jgi:hypothetical protein